MAVDASTVRTDSRSGSSPRPLSSSKISVEERTRVSAQITVSSQTDIAVDVETLVDVHPTALVIFKWDLYWIASMNTLQAR